jgi:proprotein convertase subtilisin/kexin type 5
MQFPIDKLEYLSLLECFFTCRYCGGQKDYCTECWPGDSNIFLQRLGSTSTCQPKCNSGYTSNGSIDFTCTLCDTSCLECADNGNLGDVEVCTKCADNFNFLDIATASCMAECPTGSYDKGDGTCGLCDATCGICVGNPTNCTSCNTDSSYPVLYQSKCNKECPIGFASNGGRCAPCESPCTTCGSNPSSCTSCDGTLDRIFKFGPSCLSDCPAGTIKD